MKPAWLPENKYSVKNSDLPLPQKAIKEIDNKWEFIAYDDGCCDTAKSILKWLNEPCRGEHLNPDGYTEVQNDITTTFAMPVHYYPHRHQCPLCMSTFQEEVENL